MLPKNNRLVSCQDFADLKKNGRKYQSQSFLLFYKENDQEESRFGIVVSAKISSQATQRNLVKRRLREIFSKLLPCFSGHYNFLFLTKPEILKNSYLETEKEVCDLLHRLGLLK